MGYVEILIFFLFFVCSIVDKQVIGRGAYGEVRLAKWRNIDIACKRLHAHINSDENITDLLEGMNQEMLLLTKLRHPNLVLFLGVYQDRQLISEAITEVHDLNYTRTNIRQLPVAILTELMSCSLYDVLEVYKIELTLPEIINVALDISYGLEYLHNHQPSIVHRDISSKNILISGNKAKIADLGQAKIFASTSGLSMTSRQTSMPGRSDHNEYIIRVNIGSSYRLDGEA